MNDKIKYEGKFLELLTILFIYLKLTGQITWSWWWVLSPIYFSLIIVIIVVVLALIYQYFKEKK